MASFRQMSRQAFLCHAVFVSLALLASTHRLMGQGEQPSVRAGNLEIGGFGGISFGVDKVRGAVGGNVSYAVTRVIMPYFEVGYFPGVGREEEFPTSAGNLTQKFTIPLADIHGGFHFRFPTKDTGTSKTMLVPYAVLGAGVVRYFKTDVEVTSGGRVLDRFPIAGSSDFAVNGGGGLRIYRGERLGFRIEAKIYKPNSANAFAKAEFGIFYLVK